MTLAQLRYVITVSQVGTLSEAAKRLYISQPSLTNAIKELEKELGITIFIRTNKGVILSRQGEEFLGYARQVIEQTNLIEEKYLQDHNIKHEFCISTQHYSFAVEAFVSLIKEYGGWKNTHRRFCRWRDKGTWEHVLANPMDMPDFGWLMIDSTYCKVHAHAAGAKDGNQDMSRTKGAQH